MNIGIIIIIAIAGLWALGIFLGSSADYPKPFTHTPSAIDSSVIKSQAQQTIEDTEEKRKQMMDDIKQKMQDAIPEELVVPCFQDTPGELFFIKTGYTS